MRGSELLHQVHETSVKSLSLLPPGGWGFHFRDCFHLLSSVVGLLLAPHDQLFLGSPQQSSPPYRVSTEPQSVTIVPPSLLVVRRMKCPFDDPRDFRSISFWPPIANGDDQCRQSLTNGLFVSNATLEVCPDLVICRTKTRNIGASLG